MLSSTCCLGLIIHIYIESRQTGRLFSQNSLWNTPLNCLSQQFFCWSKIKTPQSNKSHRAMHGSSPCGGTEGNKRQLDSIFQNISAFVFK